VIDIVSATKEHKRYKPNGRNYAVCATDDICADRDLEDKAKPSERVKQLEEVLTQIKSIDHPVVLAGHMNTSGTDWTPTLFERERLSAALQNSLIPLCTSVCSVPLCFRWKVYDHRDAERHRGCTEK
jgi:hypothetical protein